MKQIDQNTIKLKSEFSQEIFPSFTLFGLFLFLFFLFLLLLFFFFLFMLSIALIITWPIPIDIIFVVAFRIKIIIVIVACLGQKFLFETCLLIWRLIIGWMMIRMTVLRKIALGVRILWWRNEAVLAELRRTVRILDLFWRNHLWIVEFFFTLIRSNVPNLALCHRNFADFTEVHWIIANQKGGMAFLSNWLTHHPIGLASH